MIWSHIVNQAYILLDQARYYLHYYFVFKNYLLYLTFCSCSFIIQLSKLEQRAEAKTTLDKAVGHCDEFLTVLVNVSGFLPQYNTCALSHVRA